VTDAAARPGPEVKGQESAAAVPSWAPLKAQHSRSFPGGAAERLVFGALWAHALPGTRCWPSVALLCSETGLSRSAVLRALGELERRGLSVRTRDRGRHNVYTMIPAATVHLASRDTGVTQTPVSHRHQCQGDTGVVSHRHLTSVPQTPEVVPEKNTREEERERPCGAPEGDAASLSGYRLPRLTEIVETLHSIGRTPGPYFQRNNAHAVARKLADAPRRALGRPGFRVWPILRSIRRVAEQAGPAGAALPSDVVILKAFEEAEAQVAAEVARETAT
jgi:hypothetical protein